MVTFARFVAVALANEVHVAPHGAEKLIKKNHDKRLRIVRFDDSLTVSILVSI